MIPFFNTTSEMKSHISVMVSEMSEESLESYAINSMSDIAIITSNAVILSLWDKFKENDLTTEEEALVERIRKPIANMTLYRHSKQAVLYVSDSGYTTEEGANAKKPYQWMLRDFRAECMASYSKGMEELWDFILENKADYPTIVDSDQYKYLMGRPIQKLNQWAMAGRRIADWRTHYSLCAEMTIVWEDMSSFISVALTEEVESYLLEGSTDEDMELLLKHIRKYVAHHTIERAAPNLPISIEADGLIIKEVAGNTNNNEIAKQVSDKGLMMKQAGEEAAKYKNKLIEFLNANATADKYVGYYNAYLLNAVPKIINTTDNKIIIM